MTANNAACSDEEFVAAWKRCRSSPIAVSKFLGVTQRNVYRRRISLEKKGVYLQTVPLDNQRNTAWGAEAYAYPARVSESVRDGWLIVFSDAHYWPGEMPVAHEALLRVAKQLQPKLIIANGDVFDGANISRHEPMGWQKLPRVIDELEVVKKRLCEIRHSAPKAKCLMTVGNHDSRFDRRLATEISQFEDVPGMRLQDHLTDWPMSYTVMINEDTDPVFVLHNIKGGIHAPFNNIKAAGCSIITGHLHSQKAQPFSTLLHEWEGIDAGCLADKDHAAFSYAMDRPRDWRSGFVALRFDKEGRKYPAEFCRVIWDKKGARAVWRSDVIVTRS